MKQFIKKTRVAIALLLITSMGYADNVEKCCPAPCGKGFIGIDFLYWRTFEGGLDSCCPCAVSNVITTDGDIISKFSGRGEDFNFKWKPGFRLGVGYEFACNKWCVGAFWTRFHTHRNDAQCLCSGDAVQWNLDLDIVDAIAEYDACINPCFALKPFFGIRGGRINQTVAFGEICCSTDFIGDYATSVNNTERFSGAGVLLGLEGDWAAGCNFSFYTRASFSWLYGHFNLNFSENNTTIDTLSCCCTSKRLSAVLPVADAAIGIRWKKCICKITAILQVGLEHHSYFNYNQIGCRDDLNFDGITIGAGLVY